MAKKDCSPYLTIQNQKAKFEILMGHIFDLELPSPCVSSSRIPRSSQRRKSLPSVEQSSSVQFPASRIQTDTPIIPTAVANSVWREASFWLGEELPREWIADLAERAEVIYAHNPRFRKLLHQRGNSGRDWLWAFTRHWLSGLLIEHHPSLAERLPSEYKVGKPFSV